jgi:hypothetical protein
VLAVGCGTNPPLAGGSSQQGNGVVVGRVNNDAGGPAARTQVMLLRVGYDPVKDTGAVLTDTTDTMGNYSFAHVYPGDYTIQALQLDGRTRALIGGIHVANDTADVPSGILQAPGTVRVYLPGGVNGATGYVYAPGTVCFVLLAGHTDYVILDSVPAGAVPEISYSSINSVAVTTIRYGVPVVSGDTTVVWNPQWKYARTLVLNTSTTGADVTGTVVNFPVLIRLTPANFDFSQTKAGGADIRFTKSDTTFVPYEIERWDAVALRAEVWVRVDTVHGGDSTQSITMYWGNGNASPQSDGAAVFDTANGFQGVWHLGEAGSAIAKDATGNHYDGTPSDTAPAGAAGTIGKCRSFNGSSNFIRMSGTANSKIDFQENGTYAVSAWACVDTLDNGSHLIAGKSNEQYCMKFKTSVSPNPMVWEFVEYHDRAGWQITNSLPDTPSAKTWTCLVGVRNGTTQRFYMNGVPVDSAIKINSSTVSRNTGDDVTIGKFLSTAADTIEGKCPFLGKIDEVRIMNIAPNADWVRLCYMNQKEPDVLIRW